MIKAALFIPCYVDAFFPEVGIATLELLERLGVEVDYPLDQTVAASRWPIAAAAMTLQHRGLVREELFGL